MHLELWSVFPFRNPPVWLARFRDMGRVVVVKSACRRFGAAWFYKGDRGEAVRILEGMRG